MQPRNTKIVFQTEGFRAYLVREADTWRVLDPDGQALRFSDVGIADGLGLTYELDALLTKFTNDTEMTSWRFGETAGERVQNMQKRFEAHATVRADILKTVRDYARPGTEGSFSLWASKLKEQD